MIVARRGALVSVLYVSPEMLKSQRSIAPSSVTSTGTSDNLQSVHESIRVFVPKPISSVRYVDIFRPIDLCFLIRDFMQC